MFKRLMQPVFTMALMAVLLLGAGCEEIEQHAEVLRQPQVGSVCCDFKNPGLLGGW